MLFMVTSSLPLSHTINHKTQSNCAHDSANHIKDYNPHAYTCLLNIILFLPFVDIWLPRCHDGKTNKLTKVAIFRKL